MSERVPVSMMATILILLLLLFLLLTLLYLTYKPPPFLIRYFQHRWSSVLWHVPTHSKTIALTIDDTPSIHTSAILDILTANNCTATFFVIGSHISGHESTLQSLLLAGHELGNHAMHDEPSLSLSDAELERQIKHVDQMLHDVYAAAGVVGAPPKFFRPGSGVFSHGMCENVGRLGHRIVLGSIFPHDPQIRFWQINAMHILSMVRPGGIVICHDGRPWTVPMLKKVLPEMRRRGYRVVSVSELLEEAGQ